MFPQPTPTVSRLLFYYTYVRDVESQFARYAGRVDGTLIDGAKTHTAAAKIFNEPDQMTHGPAQSVQSPDHEDIAPSQAIEAPSQAMGVVRGLSNVTSAR